jgi:hypothetical protein
LFTGNIEITERGGFIAEAAEGPTDTVVTAAGGRTMIPPPV